MELSTRPQSLKWMKGQIKRHIGSKDMMLNCFLSLFQVNLYVSIWCYRVLLLFFDILSVVLLSNNMIGKMFIESVDIWILIVLNIYDLKMRGAQFYTFMTHNQCL